ncbi:unnamed protein product, partial [marine sediment metagenome]
LKSYPAKSLCLIPQRFAIAMVEHGWLLRNDICWSKPNPMPESVKDRFTGSWEHLFFFVKNKKYWFEQQFEQLETPLHNPGNILHPDKVAGTQDRGGFSQWEDTWRVWGNPQGRNKRDVWEITTQPYPEAHFAVYPEKLVETPILAGCPSMICKKCGKAREQIYKQGELVPDAPQYKPRGSNKPEWGVKTAMTPAGSKQGHPNFHYEQIDLGYTDCGCNVGFGPGVVMDIFAGSGTTGAVVKRLGRKYIGIELNPDYCKLHKKRLQEIPLPMALGVL